MIEQMYDLEAVLPQKGRAVFLRDHFNESLIDSLTHMLYACEGIVPRESYEVSLNILNSLDAKKKLSPFLSFLNSQLYKAIEAEDTQLIELIISQISEHDHQPSNIEFINFSNLNDYLSPLILHTFTYTLPKERKDMVHVRPLTESQFTEMKEAVITAYGKLKRITPELYQESQESISQILFINSPGLFAGSSFDLIGLFYCGYEHYWRKTTGLLDILTHEQGHIYLHLLNNLDQLVLNPDEYYFSPIREAKRPLMGLYHATFVVARITYVLEKALEYGEIPSEEEEYCQSQIKQYHDFFDEGMETLNKCAEMTPLAKGLIGTSQELLAA